MKNNNIPEKRKSRRSFFLKGFLASITMMVGSKELKANEVEETDTVKLISADGSLVEVPRKIIPKHSGAKVSRKELFEWKYKHQNPNH